MLLSFRAPLVALFTLPALLLNAQSIADARNAPLGSEVTVSGIVTNGASLGGIRYLQDDAAGIAAFPGSGSAPGFNPQPGDHITVSGTLTEFNGLLEITPISSFTINSSGNPLPEPLVITPEQMNESVESQLVRIEEAYFNNTGYFSVGTWPITATGETTQVYFASGHPLIGTSIPSGPQDITGIASQHDNNPPYNSGYQLLPRGSADIVAHTQISIQPPVVQSNLVPDGFTLAWTTTLPGSSEVFYGTTPDLGGHQANPTLTADHQLVLSGLEPARFYHVQAFSVDGADTAFAAPMYCSTASNSSGAIHVYFTKSVDTSVSSGEDAIGLFSATDDTIKAYIDRAQQTLDIAVYNTNSAVIPQAVNAAKARGVQVRWITEDSNANTGLNHLDASIPVLRRMNSQGAGMHHKFMVIDAEDPDRAVVMTGSCNWTTSGMFLDYNNLVFIHDQALARCYRMEFEEMWGGSGVQPVPVQSRFGADKTDNTPHLFNVGGTPLEVYFSPSDGTTAQIRQAIDNAANSLHFALFIFTEYSLGQAVLAAHNRPGMVVKGDVDDVAATGSRFPFLVNNGVEVFSHATEDGLLHHKYAILDEGTTGDPLVITGSHNWTASAENVNDENTVMIHDARVANLFYQEWMARHNAVMGVEEHPSEPALTAWPIPADQQLHLLPMGHGPALITVHDATGREVHREQAVGLATIRTGDWQPGLYVVRCVQDGVQGQRTVVVMR